jgi:hypothetical protein
MATLDTYVPIVRTEADGLTQFLDTLSTDDWQRLSTCDLSSHSLEAFFTARRR